MNIEEYRNYIKNKYNGSGYSYVSTDDKNLELDVHDLLVDIMTHKDSANRLISMFPNNCGLPDHCIDESEVDILESFESRIIHSDILDDGEMHIIHVRSTDTWFFDLTYDFMSYIEDICREYNVKIEDIEFSQISGWRRNPNLLFPILGLDDFLTILRCVKTGIYTNLNYKIPLSNGMDRLNYWKTH